MSPAATFVLLAARAYSGSTLLASLLGAHPQIATVSEISGRRREHQMESFQCSCGRLMNACPFWLAVEAGMHERGYADFRLANFELNFSRGSGTFERIRSGSLRWDLLEQVRDAAFGLVPGHTAALRGLGQRNRAFAETVLSLTGKRVFLDASKERMRVHHLERYLGMDLRVIHLVRDVRGVVDSVARHAGRPIDARSAAADWASTNRTLARHVARLPADRRRLVRYEDLCADPQGVLGDLQAFCGVEPHTSTGVRNEQHLLGNARRLEAGWADVRLDERWRSSLAAGDLAIIAAAAGSVARRFYPDVELGVPSAP